MRALATGLGVAALLVCSPALAGGVALPPVEFDHPFSGRLVVRQLPYWEVQQACGEVQFYESGRVEACSRLFPDPMDATQMVCFVIYPRWNGEDIGTDFLVSLIRHETGHCNGWGGEHLGARFIS